MVGDNRVHSDNCPYTSFFRLSSLTPGLYMCSIYSSLIFHILFMFISVVKLSKISNIASKMYWQPYVIGTQYTGVHQLHQYRPSRLQYREQFHGTQMMPEI